MDLLRYAADLAMPFVVLVGHQWAAGMRTGAAQANNLVGALQMACLGICLKGSALIPLPGHSALWPAWVTVALLCTSLSVAGITLYSNARENRAFKLTVEMVTFYALLAGMWPDKNTVVAMGLSLVPAITATIGGWNRGAGFFWMGESGSPAPVVPQFLLWTTLACSLTMIVYLTYNLMI